MTTRIVRSKVRIDNLCQAILQLMEAYPQLSTNALATAVGWTQSSFQRALESRDQAEATSGRAGRMSVSELVGELAMERNFEAVTQLLDAIEAALAIQTQPEEELPGYEPPTEKPAKAKRTKKSADSEDDDELAEDNSEPTEDDSEADFDENEVF